MQNHEYQVGMFLRRKDTGVTYKIVYKTAYNDGFNIVDVFDLEGLDVKHNYREWFEHWQKVSTHYEINTKATILYGK